MNNPTPDPAERPKTERGRYARLFEGRGARIEVRREGDAAPQEVRRLRRLPDGTLQWTDDAGHPIPDPNTATPPSERKAG